MSQSYGATIMSIFIGRGALEADFELLSFGRGSASLERIFDPTLLVT